MAVLFYLFLFFIFGVITKGIASSKGYDGGGWFWLGFGAGVVGIIIAACMRRYESDYSRAYTPRQTPNDLQSTFRDESRDYTFNTANSAKVKKPSRAPTYKEGLLASGGWECKKCGTVNPSYTGSCGCGNSKRENAQYSKPKEEAKPEASSAPAQEIPKANISPAEKAPKTEINAQDLVQKIQKAKPANVPDEQDVQMKKLQVLREYKALLDDGIITEEEFETKKKELL